LNYRPSEAHRNGRNPRVHTSPAANGTKNADTSRTSCGGGSTNWANLARNMGSLIKKRRKRMRKKKHKKMLKATRWQRRAAGK